jgi:TDG/mug DNA glycosylase family protein
MAREIEFKLRTRNKSIASFRAVAHSSAKILILGSMPGAASLGAAQYYAHPQNAFWKILGEITGLPADATYPQRLQGLMASGIALWDVLHSCEREGSLDSAIDSSSVRANDFAAFFRKHRQIRTVCFNGAAAQRYYNGHVLPALEQSGVTYIRLPSTSPAHAALSFQRKLAAWLGVIGPHLGGSADLRKSVASRKLRR